MSSEIVFPSYLTEISQNNVFSLSFGPFGNIAFSSGSIVNFAYINNDHQIKQSFSISAGPVTVTSLEFSLNFPIIFIGDTQGNILIFDYQQHKFLGHPPFVKGCYYVQQMQCVNDKLFVLYWSGKLVSYHINHSMSLSVNWVFEIESFSNNNLSEVNSLQPSSSTSKIPGIKTQKSFSGKPQNNLNISNSLSSIDVFHSFEPVVTNFSIDTISMKYILLYKKGSYDFSTIDISCKTSSMPFYIQKKHSLNGLKVQCAQFSLHVPGYVYILTENLLLFYSVELNSCSTLLICSKMALKSLGSFIQFFSDYKHLILIYNNGDMNFIEINNNYSYNIIKEIKKMPISQTATNSIDRFFSLSPIRDDYLVFFHQNSGLILFDLSRLTAVSLCPFFTEKETAFASNNDFIVFGTSNGNLKIRSIYDKSLFFSINAFNLNKNNGEENNKKTSSQPEIIYEPIEFVSISNENKIFFTSKTRIGFFSLNDRTLKLFNFLPCFKIIRAVGGEMGGLIVQRDNQTLGIFVNGDETFLSLPNDDSIVDFSFNQTDCASDQGSFILLRTNKYINIYNYHKYTKMFDSENPPIKRKIILNAEPTCVCLSGTTFCVGFDDCSVLLMSVNNETIARRIELKSLIPIVMIKFAGFPYNINDNSNSHSNSFLLCHTADCSLYSINLINNEGDPSLMFHVSSFSIIDSNTLLIRSNDYIHIQPILKNDEINIKDKLNLYLPTFDDYIKNYIQDSISIANKIEQQELIPEIISNKNVSHLPYFSSYGRDLWLGLLNKPSLKMKYFYAYGDNTLEYEEYICAILEKMENIERRHKLLFSALIFAHRYDDATNALIYHTNKSSFMLNTALSAVMLGFSEFGYSTTHQSTLLKNAGVQMILNEKYTDGAILLRIAHQDVAAVRSLIRTNRYYFAMKFIRSSLEQNDKKQYCFEIGKKYFLGKNYKKATMFFMAAEEYHPALFTFLLINHIAETFFFKWFLVKNNRIHELSKEKMDQLEQRVIPLKQLLLKIDLLFKKLLNTLNLNINIDSISNQPIHPIEEEEEVLEPEYETIVNETVLHSINNLFNTDENYQNDLSASDEEESTEYIDKENSSLSISPNNSSILVANE